MTLRSSLHSLRFLLVAALCLAHVVAATGQTENVGIGTANPDASALLDLVSSNKGLLIPRLTLPQRDAIVQPAKGLIIYNVTANEFEYNSGTPALPIWTRLIGVSGGNQGNDFWSTTGNLVDPNVNFLGSRNAAPLIIRTDNVTRLTIAADGVLQTQREIRIGTGGLFLEGAASPLTLDGTAGVAGNVLVSAGPGATPQYTDSLALRGISAANATVGTLTVTNIAGDVAFTGQTTFALLPDMPLAPGHLLVGNNASRAVPLAPGTDGFVLGIQGGRPAWLDPVSTINQTAWVIGGNPNPANTILGNTSTTGVVDLDIRAGNATLLHLDGTTGSIDVRGPLNLSGTTTPLLVNGIPGQAGNVLVSAGPGNTPQWSPLTLLPVWRLGGNAGTTVADVLGTTDAQDLRLATNGSVRVTVAQGTGNVSIASLAGPAQAQPSGSTEAVVVADANGTLHKRGKDALFALFGITHGRYTNNTANTQFVVVITLPPGPALDPQASITLTPESSTSVGITPFIVNGSRTATSFTINFPGGLNPGEAINWMIINP
jgi:hypothetical protein